MKNAEKCAKVVPNSQLMSPTYSKFEEVKSLLGKNYRKIISDDTGFSVSRVAQVFRDQDLSHPIMIRAIEMAKDRKDAIQSSTETLANL